MAVGKATFPKMHPVAGFELSTVSAGIKSPGRRDLVVMKLAETARVAAVFTRNAFCAAPVRLCREHLARGDIRYLITNTGNANAGTGQQGLRDALTVCRAVAERAGISATAVMPFSTGVIGEPLPVDKILRAIPPALENFSESGWEQAAWGILTTDTRPKGASRKLDIGGRPVVISGIAKGAGMIKPDMATMLGYIATDAGIDRNLLDRLVADMAGRSFNRITVDGDTSTNDSLVLVATGCGPVSFATGEETGFAEFASALEEVFVELAQAIIRDGEGATKFVEVRVSGGATAPECLSVAFTVAESPLVKTALFAGDANWGRILAAIGRSGIENLDVDGVTVRLGGVTIAERGGRAATYTEEQGRWAMGGEEIKIEIDLGRGPHADCVWTTDLSHEYVRINAEYRT